MSEEIGERKEKIESKGAYAYDLHKAIRDVQDVLKKGDIRNTAMCLEVLRDICPPEIREAINSEWVKVDNEYHDTLERIKNAKYMVQTESEYNEYKRTHRSEYRRKYGGLSEFNGNWETKDNGSVKYHIITDRKVTFDRKINQLVQETRNKLLRKIWSDILHDKFQACINCLDQHGELRKWRSVEYGKL